MSVPAKNTAIVAVLTEEDYQKVEKEWEAKGVIIRTSHYSTKRG